MWRNRAFIRIWAGQTASIFGDRVTGIALPWLILLQTHSPFETALVLAVRYVPLIVLGLFAGLAADRFDRRALMIAADMGRALVLGVVAVLGALGYVVPLSLLVVVVAVLGIGQAGFQIAYRAWLPDVVGETGLAGANAALEASDAAATLSGPLLGGGLIQAAGAALGLGADGLSYVFSAATLISIPITLADGGNSVPPSASSALACPTPTRMTWMFDEMLAGARLVLASAPQRLLKGVGMPLYLTSGAIELLLATLTQQSLHLPPLAAGAVFGAAGVGGLFGSAVAPRLFSYGWQRSLAGALLLAASGSVLLAFAGYLAPLPGFVLAFTGNLLLDGAVALSFVLTGTATTLLTPREVRGRVGAVSQMYASVVRAISVLLLGAIAARTSVDVAFLLVAAAFLGTVTITGRWLVATGAC